MFFERFKKKTHIIITIAKVVFEAKDNEILKFRTLIQTEYGSFWYHIAYPDDSKEGKWLLKNNNKQIQVIFSYENLVKYVDIEPIMIEYNKLRCPKCGRFWNPTKGECVCKERKENEF